MFWHLFYHLGFFCLFVSIHSFIYSNHIFTSKGKTQRTWRQANWQKEFKRMSLMFSPWVHSLAKVHLFLQMWKSRAKRSCMHIFKNSSHGSRMEVPFSPSFSKWKLLSPIWLSMNYTVCGILQARILEWVDFLQGIFPTQGWNPGLSHITDRFFTSWARSFLPSHSGSKCSGWFVSCQNLYVEILTLDTSGRDFVWKYDCWVCNYLSWCHTGVDWACIQRGNLDANRHTGRIPCEMGRDPATAKEVLEAPGDAWADPP